MKLILKEERPHLGGKYFYYKNLNYGLIDSDIDINYLKNTTSLISKLKKSWFKLLSKFRLVDYGLKCIDIDRQYFCQEILALSKIFSPDVIHIQHPLDAYYISYSEWQDIPIVQTVHSFWLKEISADSVSKKHYKKMLDIQKFSYENVDHFISLNQLQYCELINNGVDDKRITIIRNSVDTFRVNSDAALSNYSFDIQYVSIVCRLAPEKGVDVALRALALIDKSKRPMLIVGGDGPEKGSLEILVEELSISKSVIFLGALEHSDALGIIKGSVLSLCPSVIYNGIQDTAPLSLLESIALAVPVAASKIGGLPEYIEHGTNGYLFEQGDYQSLSSIISYHIRHIDSDEDSNLKDFMSKLPDKNDSRFWIDKNISVYERLINPRACLQLDKP